MVKERHEYKTTIEALNQEIAIKNQDYLKTIMDYEKALSDLYNSTSWKITKPLRRLKNHLKPKS